MTAWFKIKIKAVKLGNFENSIDNTFYFFKKSNLKIITHIHIIMINFQ